MLSLLCGKLLMSKHRGIMNTQRQSNLELNLLIHRYLLEAEPYACSLLK